jgi:hypothetical protein
MKTPTFALLFAGLLSTAFAAEAQDSADLTIKPKFRSARWRAVTARPDHLRLRDGRRLYRGPRLLSNVYPYYLAANAGERAAGYGYELRVSNAHRLLAPITTAEAATELARLFSGGVVVPDRATFEAIREAAARLEPQATGWGIRLHAGMPKTFGLEINRVSDGFRVSMLVFTCSGFGRLSVAEHTYTVPLDGEVKRKTRTWIEGPPQSWQTSGDVDPEEQQRLYKEVQRFRASVMRLLSRHRTIEQFKAVCERDPTFAEVRYRLGEPDRDVGSGIHIYVYRLGDGTAVVFGAAGDDDKVSYIRHLEVVSSGGPGRAKFGRVIEKIK